MFTVHRANIQEIATIRQILKETWIATYNSLFTREQIDRITENWHAPERLAVSMNDPDSYMAVAKNEAGTIVGVISTRRTGDILHLDRLYVHPSYQGQGVGKELLNAATDVFAAISAIVLEVEEMNTPAIRFYQRHGFSEQAHLAETVEGVTINIIQMRKLLPLQ